MNAIVRMLAVYTGLALLLCAMVQMEWSPLRPNGPGQWAALFLLIFPAAFVARLLFGRSAGVELEDHKTHSDCSWARVAIGLLVLMFTIGAVLGAAWWLSHPAASI